MTKNEKDMLELALVHVRVDSVLQGDSWGLVDPTDETTPQELFDSIATDIYSYSAMSEDELLAHAKLVANEDWGTDLTEEERAEIPTFTNFQELREFVRKNLDDGDLQTQTLLDVLVYQLKRS